MRRVGWMEAEEGGEGGSCAEKEWRENKSLSINFAKSFELK